MNQSFCDWENLLNLSFFDWEAALSYAFTDNNLANGVCPTMIQILSPYVLFPCVMPFWYAYLPFRINPVPTIIHSTERCIPTCAQSFNRVCNALFDDIANNALLQSDRAKVVYPLTHTRSEVFSMIHTTIVNSKPSCCAHIISVTNTDTILSAHAAKIRFYVTPPQTAQFHDSLYVASSVVFTLNHSLCCCIV